MDFRSFIAQGIDGEFYFVPEGGVDENQGSPSVKSVNNKVPVINVDPLSSVPPMTAIEDVADSDNLSYEEDILPPVGPSMHPHPEAGKTLKALGKRKSFLLAKELKDTTDFHWVVAHVTLPSWKQHLREISIEQLCDIHDRAYMRQAVLDNEIDSLKQDRAAVIAKVILDAAMKLVRSDELGMLIAKLVRSSIIYGRCATFKEVASLTEPFILEKMLGYRPLSKKVYDQAGDALASASYPFLAEYAMDPYASL
ncbi:hypothetical protein Tco_0265531 [Tanacetum coccineum]